MNFSGHLHPITLVDIEWRSLKGCRSLPQHGQCVSPHFSTSNRRICCWSQPNDDKTLACTGISSRCSWARQVKTCPGTGHPSSAFWGWWTIKGGGTHPGLHLWCIAVHFWWRQTGVEREILDMSKFPTRAIGRGYLIHVSILLWYPSLYLSI